MKSVLWNDKQLAALSDMIDIQALVADHFRSVILNLLYTSSQVVTPADFTVRPTTPASGSVVVPVFGAVDGGEIISTTSQTLNITGGTFPPTPGVFGPPPFGQKRIDIVVCRYQTAVGEPIDRWYIDPITNQKVLHPNENSRELDTYQFGVIRGSVSATPVRPPIPSGWFEVCQILVKDTGLITATEITTVVVLGTAGDLFDPILGHRHFGVKKDDAPKIIHGSHTGIIIPDIGQSIDPGTIRPDDHHSQIHVISGTDHTGSITPAQHGAIPLGDGSYHGIATPNPGGFAGFLSSLDKSNLDAIAALLAVGIPKWGGQIFHASDPEQCAIVVPANTARSGILAIFGGYVSNISGSGAGLYTRLPLALQSNTHAKTKLSTSSSIDYRFEITKVGGGADNDGTRMWASMLNNINLPSINWNEPFDVTKQYTVSLGTWETNGYGSAANFMLLLIAF